MLNKESQLTPKYQAAVFFVSDINKSKQFYSEILEQKIVADFGKNVGFEGGLSIWDKICRKNHFKDKADVEIKAG